jgi:hypothetical protein
MAPLDQNKINAFLATWNEGRPANNPLWKEVPGTYAPIGMNIASNSAVTFNPNFGYPMKMFINAETQEIKMFDARRFV